MNGQQVVFTFSEETPIRLDKFLAARLPEYSRTRLQSLIREGWVLVNGMAPHKSGQMLNKGEVVRVFLPPPEDSRLMPEAIPLEIVFEDENLMVVNKPAGMVVHPSAGHLHGTLVQAALAHAPQMAGVGGERRPGVVHRLDKDTSGLILLAKNDRTHRWLQEQFSQRNVEKTYLALVDGKPPTPSGRVEAPVGRDVKNRKRMSVLASNKGRLAISEYYTLQTFAEHTLLRVHPITGRTHQIRVHMAFIGCPVVGDTVYGRRRPSLNIGRLFLHAASLKIQLPGEVTQRTFEAPLPPDLHQALQRLQNI